MGKRILTLNIGAANVSLAEYDIGGKGALTLVNYGIAPLAAPLDAENAGTVLAPALMEIVREKGIKPGKVAMTISGQMVFPKFAAIPAAGGDEKFEQMIRYEIEQNIPFPIDEMICDRQVLGDTENGDKSVMIVAAKVDQIESLSAAVQSAGFIPELVDVAPIALVNALRRNRPEEAEQCIIALDLGAKTTSLVIVEGDKLYNRSIPVAGNSITREIATAFACPPEEAERVKLEKGYVSVGGVSEDEDPVADSVSKICRASMTRLNAEITRSINFYRSQQQGSAPVKLYLTGGSALLPQLDQFFSESLGIEVEFFNPFESIATGPRIDSDDLGTAAAFLASSAGIAMHLTGDVPFRINLMPPSLVSAKTELARIPFICGGGICVIIALAVLAFTVHREAAVVEARRDVLVDVERGLKRQDREVTEAMTKYEKAQEEAEAVRKISASRSVSLERLQAVRQALEGYPYMWIHSWENGKLVIRLWRDKVKTEPGKTTIGESVTASLKSHFDRLAAKNRVESGSKDKNAPKESVSVRLIEVTNVGKGDSKIDGEVEQLTLEVKFL